MQVIDYPRFAQLLQAARAQAGLTIRESCAKLQFEGEGIGYDIEPEEWAMIEVGESHPTNKFVSYAAKVFGIEVPMTEGEEYPAGTRYRCGTLTLEESQELDLLTKALYDFCKAKNVGLWLVACQDMERIADEDGFREESVATIRRTNQHCLPSNLAVMAHLMSEARTRKEQMDPKTLLLTFMGFKAAQEKLVTASLEKAPAGDHQLLGFDLETPTFD